MTKQSAPDQRADLQDRLGVQVVAVSRFPAESVHLRTHQNPGCCRHAIGHDAETGILISVDVIAENPISVASPARGRRSSLDLDAGVAFGFPNSKGGIVGTPIRRMYRSRATTEWPPSSGKGRLRKLFQVSVWGS